MYSVTTGTSEFTLKRSQWKLIRGLTWIFWSQRLVAGYAATLEKRRTPQIQGGHGTVDRSSPIVVTTLSTLRGSYAIWINVGNLKDDNDAVANPGEGATESLGRAMAAVVLRGHAQQASEVCKHDGRNLQLFMMYWDGIKAKPISQARPPTQSSGNPK